MAYPKRPEFVDIDNAPRTPRKGQMTAESSGPGNPVLGVLFPNGAAPNGTWMFPQRAGAATSPTTSIASTDQRQSKLRDTR